jgi:hypothetical protein
LLNEVCFVYCSIFHYYRKKSWIAIYNVKLKSDKFVYNYVAEY